MPKPAIKAAPISVRHGDQVKVISGRAKGRTGKVLSVNIDKRTVTVEHANMIKKHTRPNPSKNIKGGILEREGPVHVSNVMLVCPSCGKTTRASHSKLADGTKVRSCRHCKATFEN
jgi:large subunit ribosomal protein L24